MLSQPQSRRGESLESSVFRLDRCRSAGRHAFAWLRVMRPVMKWVVRLLLKPALQGYVPVRVQRRWGQAIGMTLLGPPGARYEARHCAGVPTLAIAPREFDRQRSVLLLHGGAYVMGGFASHRKLAAAIGAAARAQVWLPDYRLAPEHPHPAALRDALAVYADLLSEGRDPSQLVIAGDSAGGGLTLALAMAIRDAGLPPPAALVLMSPWVDLGLGGQSLTTHAARDPMLSVGWLRWAARVYCGGTDMHDAGCSPLFGDLRNLPPILIQVGSEEILLSDAQRLSQAAQAAGVACELQTFEGLWHVFQLHCRLLRDADLAVDRIGAFIHEQTRAADAAA